MTRAAVSRALAVFASAFLCALAGPIEAADLVAPSSLTASAASSSQIDLTWVDVNPNDTGASIERSLNSASGFVVIASTPKNVLSFRDSGLAAGTTYYYRVRATGRKSLFSPYSNVASATTQIVTLPANPSGLAALAASSSQINLSWSDNSSNESGFKVERAPASAGPWAQIGTTGANATSYADGGLSASTTYWYRIRSWNSAGDSGYSNSTSATTQAAVTIPAAPSNLTAVAASSSQINLSWSDNSSNESGFKVERAPASAGPWTQIGTTASVSYSDTGLFASTTYWYRVRAWNSAGDSGYSNSASATTQAAATAPAAPSNLSATAVSASQINLSWSDNSSNETGFKVERGSSSTGPWSQIGTTGAGVATYSDAAGLSPSTTYWYRVRAWNAVGDSAYSNNASATTSGGSSGGGSQIWSRRFSGTGAFDNAYALAVAVDSDGNSVVAGYFQRTVDFGGGSLVSAGGSDVFVVKYSPAGQHLWSRRFGSAYEEVAQGVGVDSSGNVLVTGYFTGSFDFGGGSLTAVGQTDIFVAKLSAAGGHVWSKSFGGFNPDRGYAIGTDSLGNVFVTGYMVGTVDFGGGPLTSAGAADVFLAKLTSAGGHVWSRHYGGTSSDIGEGLAVDPNGNVAVAGYFQGSADFGGGAIASAGANDVFAARYDGNGSHIWSRGWGGTSDDRSTGVAVDNLGNVVVTGNFLGAVDFGGGSIANSGGSDIFLVKCSPAGAHVWSKGFGTGSAVSETSNAVAVDGDGNVLLTGSIVGSLDFGGGPLMGNGSYDVFIAKFRSDSSHVWSKRAGAGYDDHGWGIAADAAGNVISAGDFYISVDFGGGALVNEAGTDSYLVKLAP